MDLERYVRRRPVEIVYVDSRGRTSKAVVSVYSVRNGRVRVLDWKRKALRTLAAGRIVAALPVAGWRVSQTPKPTKKKPRLEGFEFAIWSG